MFCAPLSYDTGPSSALLNSLVSVETNDSRHSECMDRYT